MCMCIKVQVLRVQKMTLETLELELQVILTFLIWVLNPGRTVHTLSHWALSLAQNSAFFMILFYMTNVELHFYITLPLPYRRQLHISLIQTQSLHQNMCVPMCACVREYVYLCLYLCECVYMCLCVYICVNMYICVFVCIYVYIYVCVCVCVLVSVSVYVWVCVHICMWVSECVCFDEGYILVFV